MDEWKAWLGKTGGKRQVRNEGMREKNGKKLGWVVGEGETMQLQLSNL